MEILFATFAVCAGLSAWFLGRAGRPVLGLLLGLFLGPLGLIIAAVLAAHYKALQQQKESDRRLAMLFQQTRKDLRVASKPPLSGATPAAPPPVVREERDCPWCAEPILIRARVCKHCGRDVEPLA